MENPNTWTLLHWDLARAIDRKFASLDKKAEAISWVFANHRVNASEAEVLEAIHTFCNDLESGRTAKSLIATLVDTFSK